MSAESSAPRQSFPVRISNSFQMARETMLSILDKLEPNVGVRYSISVAMANVYLSRVWALGGYRIITYMLCGSNVGKAASVWIAHSFKNRDDDSEGSNGNNPEFNFWTHSVLEIVLAYFMTFCPSILDIPIAMFWPLTLGYAACMGLAIVWKYNEEKRKYHERAIDKAKTEQMDKINKSLQQPEGDSKIEMKEILMKAVSC